MKLLIKLLKLCVLCGVFVCLINTISGDNVDVKELTTNWILTNNNGDIKKENVKIPSGVYSALYGEDVLYSYNDTNMRWISRENWTYTRTFLVDPSKLMAMSVANLTFHGIDTVAEIRLNHNLLGRTDNMFVRYTYDVTKILQTDNVLEIELTSPVYAAAAKAYNDYTVHSLSVPPPSCPSPRYNGECHMNMLRKMQASFAWDWGLAAPSMGVWKTIALEYYEVALIRDVDVIIDKNATHWNMHVRVFVDVGGNQDFYAELTFYAVELLVNPVIISDYKTKKISHRTPVIEFDQSIPIDEVTLWWPNGHGEQKLYPLHFTLNAWLDKSGPSARAETKSQKSIRIGFRTIELVEETAPAGNGNTFLFKVNGQEIFMKGTNYIPSHILPELGAEKSRITHLLQSVKETHMNMIRVWGGGVYESDLFYQLADQYGILIWQDMMFACAMYPALPDFLASVRLETIQNAKRIAHHPSIAIFAANNENELALAQNWYGTILEKKRFEAEYREMYLATVAHELKIVAHSSRPSPLISSPSNGKQSAVDNYISAHPADPNYGDVHFYDALADGWDPKIYPNPRFASEYGFQSLPKMESWKRTLAPNDNLLDLINHRQHHPMAMLPITSLVRRHLPLPLPEEENYAEALIYFSQVSQAMSTKIETELYRSLRDTEFRTMGALYWQLNDVWVTPSWSSIDFYGNYKLLHYWAREFMAPIAIFALYNSTSKAVHIALACDLFEVDTDNLNVTANTYMWSDLYEKNSTTWPVTLQPNGVQYDKVIPVKDIFVNRFTNNNCFIEYVLHRGTSILSRTYFFPSSLTSAVGVADPEITWAISQSYCSELSSLTRSYSLTITVKKPAIFVYIELVHPSVEKYKLSLNGYMQVTPIQMVQLEFEDEKCLEITRDNIKILTVNQFMI